MKIKTCLKPPSNTYIWGKNTGKPRMPAANRRIFQSLGFTCHWASREEVWHRKSEPYMVHNALSIKDFQCHLFFQVRTRFFFYAETKYIPNLDLRLLDIWKQYQTYPPKWCFWWCVTLEYINKNTKTNNSTWWFPRWCIPEYHSAPPNRVPHLK